MKHNIFRYNALKRGSDIFGASVGLIVATPIMLIASIGIILSSPGPILYKSCRVCKDNKPFTLYKFRSMHMFEPQKEGQRSEGTFVGNNRIFKFGKFMRKSKIDELPQMINILAGQMSIVGPRPISIESAEKNYIDEYEIITSVKPGLTCLDSLFDYAHGELIVKDNDEYVKKVIPIRRELAKLYVENQCFKLDAYCVARTIELIYRIVIKKQTEIPYTKYEKEARRRYFGEES